MTVLQAPRLAPETFALDADKLRSGATADKYFVRTKDILVADNHHPRVLMQVFQKKNAVLAGIDEAIAVLKLGVGYYDPQGSWVSQFDQLTVKALRDGTILEPKVPVLTIEGDYSLFAHLETQYLGVLARATMVATAVREVVVAAGARYDRATGERTQMGKPILFFAARFDGPEVQARDGYAAMIGGATAVSTDEGASWLGGEGVGTMPHGLIAAYGGDTVLAAKKYVEHQKQPVTPLVDFDNDCVGTSLAVARELRSDLSGVRLDTSESNVDISVAKFMAHEFGGTSEDWQDARSHRHAAGVNATLVQLVRDGLDSEGFHDVKIVVSGGFNPDKIRRFEESKVPVDVYGVGASLLTHPINFTADIVVTDGKPCAKVGRAEIPNPLLETVQ